MSTQENNHKSLAPEGFIPAKESRFVILFFKWYTYWLCKRRFSSVWLDHHASIPDEKSVLFIVNHHSWWDGLIPLLLNEFVFHKRARAIMEDKQMKQFSFFSRIGAMSINRENVRSAVYTLQQAAEWLNKPNTSLYLFPEGKITNPAAPIKIEGGVLRILKSAPDCIMVPISLHISTQRGDKPELFIRVGAAVEPEKRTALPAIQGVMQDGLDRLREDSLVHNHKFKKIV